MGKFLRKALATLGVVLLTWRAALVVLAFIGSSVVSIPTAGAWDHTVTRRVEVQSYISPHPVLYTIIVGADWNSKTPAQCNSLYPCFGTVNWRKDYQQGIQLFDHWYTPVYDSGQLASGVRWRNMKVTAEFRNCIVPGWDFALCVRHTTWVKLTIRTNGTSSLAKGGDT